jgi:hypothetical protein
LRDEGLQLLRYRRLQNIPLQIYPLAHAEAEFAIYQGLDPFEEEIIETRPGLATDFDGMFETLSSDQRYARAFPLQ